MPKARWFPIKLLRSRPFYIAGLPDVRLSAGYFSPMKTMQGQLSSKFNFSVHKIDFSCMYRVWLWLWLLVAKNFLPFKLNINYISMKKMLKRHESHLFRVQPVCPFFSKITGKMAKWNSWLLLFIYKKRFSYCKLWFIIYRKLAQKKYKQIEHHAQAFPVHWWI